MKHLIASSFIFIAFLKTADAQLEWLQKADFIGGVRYSPFGFSIGSKGYIGTGSDTFIHPYYYPGCKGDFWEYDTLANSWTQKADFGGGPRFEAIGFSIGSKGYAGTGTDLGGNTRSDFWEYDPVSNSWLQKADFGGGARTGATGFSIGTKGYIGTGLNSIFYNPIDMKDFWEYDTTSNSWAQKADFGGGVRVWAVGLSIGQKGYIGGGYNGVVDQSDFWEYDTIANTWTQKAPIGANYSEHDVAFSIGSNGYLLKPSGSGDFLKYEPMSDNWIKEAGYGGGGVAGFSIGTKGYIFNGNLKNNFWEYNPCVITLISSTSICIGGSAQLLTVNDSEVTSYNWSPTAGLDNSTIANPIASPTTTTTYTVTAVMAGCGTPNGSITFKVNPLPTANITAAGPTTFCQYSNVLINASVGVGSSYQWLNNGNKIIGGTDSSFVASDSGKYCVVITDTNGCSNTSSTITTKLIPLPPYPNVSVSGSTTFCQGGSVLFNAHDSAGLSYQWLNNGGIISGATDSSYVANLDASYSLSVQDLKSGCAIRAFSDQVIVWPLPISQAIFGNPSITPFQTYPYAINPVTGITLNWIVQGGAITSGQGTNTINVLWGNAGPYTVTLIQTNSFGCTDTATLLVVNNTCSLPVSIVSGSSATPCQGDTVLLVAQVSQSVSYKWVRNGIFINRQINDTLPVTGSGSYQVQVTSSSCTNISNPYSINYYSAPPIPVISGNSSSGRCNSHPDTLVLNNAYSGYLWNTGEHTSSIIVDSSGDYSVTVTNSTGCSAKSNLATVNLSLLPPVPICIVTVDTLTGKNLIVWEKPANKSLIDSFIIYTESNVAGVYKRIGANQRDSLSIFLDNTSNPQVASSRYKLGLKDTCGHLSSLSPEHKTIHLTVNLGIGTAINLIWSAYEGISFGSYNIYRGTSPSTLNLIYTIQSNLFSYTDLAPPANEKYYVIEVVGVSCNPTRSVTSSMSNIANTSNLGIKEVTQLEGLLYPNPTNQNTTLQLNQAGDYTLYITDISGRILKTESFFGDYYTINLHNFSPGVYLLRVKDSNNYLGRWKIVKVE